MNDRTLFVMGLEMFLFGYCRGNRDNYIAGMVHDGGYKIAAQEFFKAKGLPSAVCTVDELPEWMTESILDFERKVFGVTLFDKQ